MSPFDKVIQSKDQWNGIRIFFLSLSCQTLQLFNECGVEIFNHYKDFYKKKNIKSIMTEEVLISNLKQKIYIMKRSFVNVECESIKLYWQQNSS